MLWLTPDAHCGGRSATRDLEHACRCNLAFFFHFFFLFTFSFALTFLLLFPMSCRAASTKQVAKRKAGDLRRFRPSTVGRQGRKSERSARTTRGHRRRISSPTSHQTKKRRKRGKKKKEEEKYSSPKCEARGNLLYTVLLVLQYVHYIL